MKNTKKVVLMAIFIAIGLVLQIIESMLPVLSFPGGKIGLANIVSVLNIYMFGGINALIVALVRSVLGCVVCGNISAIPYSVAGSLLSIVVMAFCRRKYSDKLSIIGVSIVGSFSFNCAQVVVAMLIFANRYIISYLPLLLLIGNFSGLVIGIIAKNVYEKIIVKGDFKC